MDVPGIAAALRTKVRASIRDFVWTLGRIGNKCRNHGLIAGVTEELGNKQDIAPSVAIWAVTLNELDG